MVLITTFMTDHLDFISKIMQVKTCKNSKGQSKILITFLNYNFFFLFTGHRQRGGPRMDSALLS